MCPRMEVTNYKSGDTVLLRGRVVGENLVQVAPGAELPLRSVTVACDVPRGSHGSKGLLLFFATDHDRQDFISTFLGAYDGGHAVPVPG